MANSNEWLWPSHTTKHVPMNTLWILASIRFTILLTFEHVKCLDIILALVHEHNFHPKLVVLTSRSIHFLLHFYDNMQITISENV